MHKLKHVQDTFKVQGLTVFYSPLTIAFIAIFYY